MKTALLPPKTEWVRTGMTLPKALLKRLGETRAEVNADRQDPDKLSRDDLVRVFLEWALAEYGDQKAKR